jgi:hypothetical protein
MHLYCTAARSCHQAVPRLAVQAPEPYRPRAQGQTLAVTDGFGFEINL